MVADKRCYCERFAPTAVAAVLAGASSVVAADVLAGGGPVAAGAFVVGTVHASAVKAAADAVCIESSVEAAPVEVDVAEPEDERVATGKLEDAAAEAADAVVAAAAVAVVVPEAADRVVIVVAPGRRKRRADCNQECNQDCNRSR